MLPPVRAHNSIARSSAAAESVELSTGTSISRYDTSTTSPDLQAHGIRRYERSSARVGWRRNLFVLASKPAIIGRDSERRGTASSGSSVPVKAASGTNLCRLFRRADGPEYVTAAKPPIARGVTRSSCGNSRLASIRCGRNSCQRRRSEARLRAVLTGRSDVHRSKPALASTARLMRTTTSAVR